MENLNAATSGSDAAQSEPDAPSTDIQLKAILCDVLGLDPDDAAEFDEDTGLFGHLPELDSMAVAGLLTEMEDRLDIIIEDEDVDGEMLETYGGLLDFAEGKIAEQAENKA
ncbi:MAG: acyl carrier protein, partial [Erythrobacter sp.]